MGLILITGGNRGLGRATALKFAEKGHDVILTYRSKQQQADEVAHLIDQMGRKAYPVQMDISKQAEIDRAIDEINRRFSKIDYLFNNAGMMNPLMPFSDQTWEMWNKILSVNVIGQWYVTKKIIPAMIENKEGAIVYNSSISGVISNPMSSDYAASKHAVVGMAKAQALECAQHNIRINVVCPGVFRSDMYNEYFLEATDDLTHHLIASERIADPEEIAGLVYWLLVDGSYCFGSVFVIDGGITAGPKLRRA